MSAGGPSCAKFPWEQGELVVPNMCTNVIPDFSCPPAVRSSLHMGGIQLPVESLSTRLVPSLLWMEVLPCTLTQLTQPAAGDDYVNCVGHAGIQTGLQAVPTSSQPSKYALQNHSGVTEFLIEFPPFFWGHGWRGMFP